MSKHRILEVKRVSRHNSYHGWPTVALLRDGQLLVVVSAGRERHVCPFGQVHLLRSSDRGVTWSDPEILANGPLDDRDAGIVQTPRGTVLVNWFTSVAWMRRLEAIENGEVESPPEDQGFVSRCRKVRAGLSDAIVGRELGTWMLRSTDGGRTWSDKIDCGVGSPHGPTVLRDGRLLFVGNLKSDPDLAHAGTAYGRSLGAMLSDDDGESWSRGGAISQREGDALGTYHEPHAVQAADGRILVHIRNHSRQDPGHLLQSESTDGGKTFSQPRDTGIVGLPPHLLRLRDGRLLCTYGYRIPPYGNRAVVSEDDGRTWGEPMILDEKPDVRDLGYPSTVALDDGTLLSLWYERLPGDRQASLQAAKWTLP